jgi:NADH-quinone oxidoreductase subunit M
MLVLFLFLVPMLGGLLAFFIKEDRYVRTWSLLVSLAVLGLMVAANLAQKPAPSLEFSASWLGSLEARWTFPDPLPSDRHCLPGDPARNLEYNIQETK